MSFFKKLSIVLAILILFSVNVVFAEVPYNTYNYDDNLRAVPSPAGYLPEKVLTYTEMELPDNLNTPSDLSFDKNGKLYILDGGNNRIVVLNEQLKFDRIISKFNVEGKDETFNNPKGIFINDNGDIYVADTGNARIVILDNQGNLKQIVGKPVADIIPKDFAYKPLKVAVDKLGRIFVVAEGVVEGLLQFNPKGEFERYFGSNKVSPNYFEMFIRQFLNRQQRAQRILILPVEYRNVAIDKEGFLYACARGTYDQIKRLNALGDNIIKREGRIGDRYGDLYYNSSNPVVTDFADLAIDESNTLYALDNAHGRVYVYSALGDLLFIVGGISNQKGNSLDAVAIDIWKGKFYVLDESKGIITVYKPTDFGELVFYANSFYMQGKYAESAKPWQEVLKRDAHFDLAYIGLGNAYMKEGKFKEAMKCFKTAYYAKGYSKALKEYRAEFLRKNFAFIMNLLIILILLYFIVRKVLRSKNISIKEILDAKIRQNEVLRDLFFVFYIMIHPFDGFWELKRERKKSGIASVIILILLCIVTVFKVQLTNFLYNPFKPENINIASQIFSIVGPICAWVVLNWAVTTLFEGKGTMKDIWVTTVYSLFPLVLFYIPQIFLSHVFTLEESAYYSIIGTVGVIWTLLMMFAGFMTIHDYTPSKTIGTAALSIVGILFVMFIGMVFFNTIQQFGKFIQTSYLELKYMFQ
ncbi:YIP1 family protein [Caldicellulosiruptoraceae bacterium PP1]